MNLRPFGLTASKEAFVAINQILKSRDWTAHIIGRKLKATWIPEASQRLRDLENIILKKNLGSLKNNGLLSIDVGYPFFAKVGKTTLQKE